MGILSEIDMMNRDAEDDAFEVSSDSETVDSFSEEFEPVEPPKPKPQEEEAEEARKKAEFDAAEAKRKAEWEAKQAQKKLREQQELDRLAAMSDDDVMQASMNRVSQDTERLTRRNMKLCVMEDGDFLCQYTGHIFQHSQHVRVRLMQLCADATVIAMDNLSQFLIICEPFLSNRDFSNWLLPTGTSPIIIIAHPPAAILRIFSKYASSESPNGRRSKDDSIL